MIKLGNNAPVVRLSRRSPHGTVVKVSMRSPFVIEDWERVGVTWRGMEVGIPIDASTPLPPSDRVTTTVGHGGR